MKHLKRISVARRDNAHATRAIGRLLHDPTALETSFPDVVNTIRLFTDGDDDNVDILQGALLSVFSSNLELRAQILEIARRSHTSGKSAAWHRSVVQSDTADSDETDELRAPLGSAQALQLPDNKLLIKGATPTAATQFPGIRNVRHNQADDSDPHVNGDADIPTARGSSNGSAEEVDLLLVQKLICNLIAGTKPEAGTSETGGSCSGS